MKVSGIDIESNVERIKQHIKDDTTLSSSMRTTLDLSLLCYVSVLDLIVATVVSLHQAIQIGKKHQKVTVRIKRVGKKAQRLHLMSIQRLHTNCP